MQGFLTNLVIFIVIGIGWLMRVRGKMTPAGIKDMNALLFSLLMPINFFKAGTGFNTEMLKGWGFAETLIGAYIVASLVSWFMAKFASKDPKRRAVSVLTAVRPNSVFIGLPVLTLWLGQAGQEAQLIYIAVCTPYFNVIPLLMSQIALTGKADRKSIVSAFLNTFKNPVLIGGIVGLLIGAAGLTPYIPQWMMRTINVLANCGNGLALLVIGASLRPETLLDDIKASWPDMLMKLFIHPAIIMIAFMLFPIENVFLMRTAVVASSIAPAFNCFVLARGFGMDGDYAAILVASSTLISMGTMLIWMELASRIFV